MSLGWPARRTPVVFPRAILEGSHDHREPYPRDKGVRFEPIPGKVHPFDDNSKQRFDYLLSVKYGY